MTLPKDALQKCENLHIDSIDKPADDQFLDDYIALTTAQQIQTRDTEPQVIIDALAKECFLMGVNQVI